MSRGSGFLQLRRGLWEHLRDGRMSVTEALAFIYICSEADTRTGIWKGCAKSVAGELGIPERTARDVLEKLERGDYIRRFAVPGRHACYPILVHKFRITDGEHNGEQLNALDSSSPCDLAYFPCEQSVDGNGEQGVEHGAAQKRKRTEKENEKQSAETATASQPVAAFHSDLLIVTQAQDAKLADVYPWVDRQQEYRKMDLWLAANRPRRIVKKALAFCQNWFNKIPCPSAKGSNYGKSRTDPEQRTRENLKAAGLLN